jgi:hypothetical protein
VEHRERVPLDRRSRGPVREHDECEAEHHRDAKVSADARTRA